MNMQKSLQALAGDNDRIFIILDDRDDVWANKSYKSYLNDDKDYGKIPTNLLKIPPYFYYEKHALARLKHFEMLQFNVSRKTDLDLTLLTYKSFLLRVHQ